MSQNQPHVNTSFNESQPPEITQSTPTPQIGVDQLNQHMASLADEVSQMPIPVDESDPNDFRAFGEKIRIHPGQQIPPPPICISIEQNGKSEIFGTLGNYSVVIGKAKSRKTTAVSIIAASALALSPVLNRVTGSFPDNKHTMLYFDTEQGDYHLVRVVDRICKLCGQPAPENLLVYPLRGQSASYILAFIEWHINNTPNVGLVIIDGIRDTVTDINDSVQANERATDLLRLSKDHNIHILTVLHMNKGNDSIRGALGTELQNKAETVAVISVDSADKNISVISPSEIRNKAFEPFAFSVDENGIPFLLDDVPESATPTHRTKKPTADTMATDEIQAIIQRAFLNEEYLRYAQLRTNVIEASQFIGVDLAKSRSEEFIRRVETMGYITKSRPVSQRYDVYKLITKKIVHG